MTHLSLLMVEENQKLTINNRKEIMKTLMTKKEALLLGDYRRLTKEERKHPSAILKYPKGYIFKSHYPVGYGKWRKGENTEVL